MKTKKRVRSLATLLLTLCMLFATTCPIMAEPMQSAEDPRESVMGISIGYETDNGVYQWLSRGTCFLVNDEYVLTCYHVLEQNAQFLELAASVAGAPIQANDSHIKIYVHISHDIKIEASVHKSVQSAEMDFALVKLTEKVYDRKPLALGDSDIVNVRDEVHAMGFPYDSGSTKDYYTKDDVSVTDGAISKVTENSVGDLFEHTAVINSGSSGGPLLNANDEVIGVNGSTMDTKYYAAHINYIKGIMDTFGIPYIGGGSTVTEPDDNTESETTESTEDDSQLTGANEYKEDNTAILAELNSTISEAKSLDTAGYTQESVDALNDKIGSAESVVANASATAQEITSATDALNQAMLGMEKEEGPDMVVIIGIAAAAVIAIVIVVVVVMNNKKKNQPQPAPQAPVAPTVSQEGAGETTLLNQGAGETTILGGGAGSAYLVRRKNGQKIMINVQNFKIGKERSRVNYCVSDNSSISRVHCEIVKKGADYYVVDKGATNFTFVNGIQLSPNTEMLLSNNAVLKLSDEEFEFHL